MNKKIILATVATIAAVTTAQGVKADESTGTLTAGNEASTVTTPEVGATGTETHETTAVTEQPTAEATTPQAGSQSNDHNQQGNATQFVKDGSDIQVTNPDVVIDQSNGNGK